MVTVSENKTFQVLFRCLPKELGIQFRPPITRRRKKDGQIPFSWLPEGKQYIATIYEDGKDADWDTNPQSYRIRKVVVTPKSVLKQKLAASGGVAISIKEADKAEMKGLKTIR